MIPQPSLLPGEFTIASLPPARNFKGTIAWTTDRIGGSGFMFSNGTSWSSIVGTFSEVYSGVTDGSGLLEVTFSNAFTSTPLCVPVLSAPATSGVVVRATLASTTGCTVITEQRTTVTILGIDVVSSSLNPIASQAVKVFVMGI